MRLSAIYGALVLVLGASVAHGDLIPRGRKSVRSTVRVDLGDYAKHAYRPYVVREKDTLSSIAEKELGNRSRVAELVSLNELSNADELKIGQDILLPPRSSGEAGRLRVKDPETGEVREEAISGFHFYYLRSNGFMAKSFVKPERLGADGVVPRLRGLRLLAVAHEYLESFEQELRRDYSLPAQDHPSQPWLFASEGHWVIQTVPKEEPTRHVTQTLTLTAIKDGVVEVRQKIDRTPADPKDAEGEGDANEATLVALASTALVSLWLLSRTRRFAEIGKNRNE